MNEITVNNYDAHEHNKTLAIRYGEKGYRCFIHVNRYPTYNCQVSSIGLIKNLLSIPRTKEGDALMTKVIYRLRQETNSQVLFDIRSEDLEPILLIFHKYINKIIFKNEYKSTNGSKMTMVFFKWT